MGWAVNVLGSPCFVLGWPWARLSTGGLSAAYAGHGLDWTWTGCPFAGWAGYVLAMDWPNYWLCKSAMFWSRAGLPMG